jgi:hypothetical protein
MTLSFSGKDFVIPSKARNLLFAATATTPDATILAAS